MQIHVGGCYRIVKIEVESSQAGTVQVKSRIRFCISSVGEYAQFLANAFGVANGWLSVWSTMDVE